MATNLLQALNGALFEALEKDDRVVFMGEDILDPYGGAFKVARGLSSSFPDRVLATPISEAGFAGVAVGMAMRGWRPIVEIMFGDFLALAADQLLNHATKYQWMYNDKVRVPLVVRAPMGGRRGYGPTHSQSIEKHFFGMAGLKVLAPHPFTDPGALLRAAIDDEEPVLFVENKLMYARPIRKAQAGRIGHLFARTTAGPEPTVTVSFDEIGRADVTLVAYGGMAELAVDAAEEFLMEHEIVCEVVIPSRLTDMDMEPVLESLRSSAHLLTCEEGSLTCGFGSEVVAKVCLGGFDLLTGPPIRVGAQALPIANSLPLEDGILPQRGDIVLAGLALLGGDPQCASSRS